MIINIGTRKSALALVQAELVIQQIKLYYPSIECKIIKISTTGDIVANKNLRDIGGKALFVKEIEIALKQKQIDIAVHSLKDVPGQLPSGLILAGVLERTEANDALVSLQARSIAELPQQSIVGTSSPRRKCILQNIRPDLRIVDFRGNVDSRIHKLMNKEVDALILATAGLNRLNMFNPNYCHSIAVSEMLPAVGQGAIVMEIRKNDSLIQEICSRVSHYLTWQLVQGERAFLEYLNADCDTPAAGYAEILTGEEIQMSFMLANTNGLSFYQQRGSIAEAKFIAVTAARRLLEDLGGRK